MLKWYTFIFLCWHSGWHSGWGTRKTESVLIVHVNHMFSYVPDHMALENLCIHLTFRYNCCICLNRPLGLIGQHDGCTEEEDREIQGPDHHHRWGGRFPKFLMCQPPISEGTPGQDQPYQLSRHSSRPRWQLFISRSVEQLWARLWLFPLVLIRRVCNWAILES